MSKYFMFACALAFAANFMTKKPLNVRNNNPLNIRFNAANDWLGQVGERAGFARFESAQYGFRAAYVLLTRYQSEYGLTSISEIITRWAPNDENNTKAYIDYVADKLNKWTFTEIQPDEIPALLYYMAEFEGAKGAFTFEQINQGIKLA